MESSGDLNTDLHTVKIHMEYPKVTHKIIKKEKKV